MNPMHSASALSNRQRGFSLIDALVGFLVLSLALLGMVRLQSLLRSNADASHERSEAVRLAQQRLESLRSGSPVQDTPVVEAGSTTAYNVRDSVVERGLGPLKATAIRVSWTDRQGEAQTVTLDGGLSVTSPVYSALLTLPGQDLSVSPVRHLPFGAIQLSDGQGLLPREGGSGGASAWLFNTGTGQVTASCGLMSAPSASSARLLTRADLGRCDALQGSWLGGYIRFSLGPVPDAIDPRDAPLPLHLALTLTPAATEAPQCDTRTVSLPGPERFIAYVCLIPTSSDSMGWSGRLDLVPEGWSLGQTAATRKVCRYSADLDGSGRIDSNQEHPDRYRQVIGPLLQQNYLVIRGDLPCPQAVPPHNEASAATVQHQP